MHKCRLLYLVCGTYYAVCLSDVLLGMSYVSCLMPHTPRIIRCTSRLVPSSLIASHVLRMPYVLRTTRYAIPGIRRAIHIASYVPCGCCRYRCCQQNKKKIASSYFTVKLLTVLGGNDLTGRRTNGRIENERDTQTEAHRCSILRSISSASIITTTDAALVWRRAEFDGTL